jgi:hypothetical protein
MPVNKTFFLKHYLRETMWTAKAFVSEVPGYITIVNDVKGLKEGYSQFNLNQTDDGTGNGGYRIIYQSEKLNSLMGK